MVLMIKILVEKKYYSFQEEHEVICIIFDPKAQDRRSANEKVAESREFDSGFYELQIFLRDFEDRSE